MHPHEDDDNEDDHYWVEVHDLFGSELECACGERPLTQAEMDIHRVTTVV